MRWRSTKNEFKDVDRDEILKNTNGVGLFRLHSYLFNNALRSKKIMFIKILMCGLALAGLTASYSASAALGGYSDSINQDRINIKATKAITRPVQHQTPSGDLYSVQELITPTGTSVRQYVRSDGKVFAVTWSGPTVPDLRQLLGPYFAEYATVERDSKQPRTHAHRVLKHDDLVVRSRGHMRAFSGKAYLLSMMPNGVVVDDLQ